MMKKTSMKMRAPVSTSAKLKSKLEEDSWELTRKSDDEEDRMKMRAPLFTSAKLESKIGEEDS